MKKIKKITIKNVLKKVRSEHANMVKVSAPVRMVKNKTVKTSSPLQNPFRMSDAILVYGGATICALIVVTALLEIVLYGSWRLPKVGDLKGAAAVSDEIGELVDAKKSESNFLENYTANVALEGDDSTQETQTTDLIPTGDIFVETFEVNSVGARSEKDVLLFDGAISGHQDATLRELIFHTDGYARPYDVASMQLYVNGKFVAETPVFEGKGKFSSLKLIVEPGEQMFVKVRGQMSNEAVAGDRLQIGFTEVGDMNFESDSGKKLQVGGKFPIWGGLVSVIGDRAA